ncbi:MAG: NAD-dependent epimerase/dehydratase family protein [bacterium]|nr:NAD-dependent epimerase/dehydratase family protein [bacterium]
MAEKKVLISGCSGFLATYLIKTLLKENNEKYEIHGFTEVPAFKSEDIKVTQIDIRNREAVFALVEEIKPDITFHLAAISNVGYSWKNQKLTYDINFVGSSNLIEAISAYSPACRVLLMSSAELYGGFKGATHTLIDETVPRTARNPYALSKLAMEMAGELHVQARGMDIIKLRSFNFTGPSQDKKFVSSDFSYQIAEIEKGLREPVIKAGNLSAVRDISDVRDIARYLSVIAREGEKDAVYNLCSGKALSIRELLETLLSLSQKEIKIVVDDNKIRPIDIPRLAGNNALIQKKFNLFPQYKIEQTLADILNYWRDEIKEP